MVEKKRGPGRPQLHKKGTRLMVIRVPEEVGTVIEGVISRVKVLEGDVRIPTPYVLIEALRARLKQLANRDPQRVESALKALDRASLSYEHVEPLTKVRQARNKANHFEQ
jgi:hypothetical protein